MSFYCAFSLNLGTFQCSIRPEAGPIPLLVGIMPMMALSHAGHPLQEH